MSDFNQTDDLLDADPTEALLQQTEQGLATARALVNPPDPMKASNQRMNLMGLKAESEAVDPEAEDNEEVFRRRHWDALQSPQGIFSLRTQVDTDEKAGWVAKMMGEKDTIKALGPDATEEDQRVAIENFRSSAAQRPQDEWANIGKGLINQSLDESKATFEKELDGREAGYEAGLVRNVAGSIWTGWAKSLNQGVAGSMELLSNTGIGTDHLRKAAKYFDENADIATQQAGVDEDFANSTVGGILQGVGQVALIAGTSLIPGGALRWAGAGASRLAGAAAMGGRIANVAGKVSTGLESTQAVSAAQKIATGTSFMLNSGAEYMDAFDQAKQNGMTDDEARAVASQYGLTSGLIDTVANAFVLGRLFGGKFGSKAALRAAEGNAPGFFGKISALGEKGITKFTKGALESMAVEGTTEGLQRAYQNVLTDSEFFDGVAQEAFIGSIVGGGASVAGKGITKIADAEQDKMWEKMGFTTESIKMLREITNSGGLTDENRATWGIPTDGYSKTKEGAPKDFLGDINETFGNGGSVEIGGRKVSYFIDNADGTRSPAPIDTKEGQRIILDNKTGTRIISDKIVDPNATLRYEDTGEHVPSGVKNKITMSRQEVEMTPDKVSELAKDMDNDSLAHLVVDLGIRAHGDTRYRGQYFRATSELAHRGIVDIHNAASPITDKVSKPDLLEKYKAGENPAPALKDILTRGGQIVVMKKGKEGPEAKSRVVDVDIDGKVIMEDGSITTVESLLLDPQKEFIGGIPKTPNSLPKIGIDAEMPEGYTAVRNQDTDENYVGNVAELTASGASDPIAFLRNISRDQVNGKPSQRALSARILLGTNALGDVKVKFGRYGVDKNGKAFTGRWFPEKNEILINLDAKRSSLSTGGKYDANLTLLHELHHAAFQGKMTSPSLTTEERKAVEGLREVHNAWIEKYSKPENQKGMPEDFKRFLSDDPESFVEFAADLLVSHQLQNQLDGLATKKGDAKSSFLKSALDFITGRDNSEYSNLAKAWRSTIDLTKAGEPSVSRTGTPLNSDADRPRASLTDEEDEDPADYNSLGEQTETATERARAKDYPDSAAQSVLRQFQQGKFRGMNLIDPSQDPDLADPDYTTDPFKPKSAKDDPTNPLQRIHGRHQTRQEILAILHATPAGKRAHVEAQAHVYGAYRSTVRKAGEAKAGTELSDEASMALYNERRKLTKDKGDTRSMAAIKQDIFRHAEAVKQAIKSGDKEAQFNAEEAQLKAFNQYQWAQKAVDRYEELADAFIANAEGYLGNSDLVGFLNHISDGVREFTSLNEVTESEFPLMDSTVIKDLRSAERKFIDAAGKWDYMHTEASRLVSEELDMERRKAGNPNMGGKYADTYQTQEDALLNKLMDTKKEILAFRNMTDKYGEKVNIDPKEEAIEAAKKRLEAAKEASKIASDFAKTSKVKSTPGVTTSADKAVREALLEVATAKEELTKAQAMESTSDPRQAEMLEAIDSLLADPEKALSRLDELPTDVARPIREILSRTQTVTDSKLKDLKSFKADAYDAAHQAFSEAVDAAIEFASLYPSSENAAAEFLNPLLEAKANPVLGVVNADKRLKDKKAIDEFDTNLANKANEFPSNRYLSVKSELETPEALQAQWVENRGVSPVKFGELGAAFGRLDDYFKKNSLAQIYNTEAGRKALFQWYRRAMVSQNFPTLSEDPTILQNNFEDAMERKMAYEGTTTDEGNIRSALKLSALHKHFQRDGYPGLISSDAVLELVSPNTGTPRAQSALLRADNLITEMEEMDIPPQVVSQAKIMRSILQAGLDTSVEHVVAYNRALEDKRHYYQLETLKAKGSKEADIKNLTDARAKVLEARVAENKMLEEGITRSPMSPEEFDKWVANKDVEYRQFLMERIKDADVIKSDKSGAKGANLVAIRKAAKDIREGELANPTLFKDRLISDLESNLDRRLNVESSGIELPDTDSFMANMVRAVENLESTVRAIKRINSSYDQDSVDLQHASQKLWTKLNLGAREKTQGTASKAKLVKEVFGRQNVGTVKRDSKGNAYSNQYGHTYLSPESGGDSVMVGPVKELTESDLRHFNNPETKSAKRFFEALKAAGYAALHAPESIRTKITEYFSKEEMMDDKVQANPLSGQMQPLPEQRHQEGLDRFWEKLEEKSNTKLTDGDGNPMVTPDDKKRKPVTRAQVENSITHGIEDRYAESKSENAFGVEFWPVAELVANLDNDEAPATNPFPAKETITRLVVDQKDQTFDLSFIDAIRTPETAALLPEDTEVKISLAQEELNASKQTLASAREEESKRNLPLQSELDAREAEIKDQLAKDKKWYPEGKSKKDLEDELKSIQETKPINTERPLRDVNPVEVAAKQVVTSEKALKKARRANVIVASLRKKLTSKDPTNYYSLFSDLEAVLGEEETFRLLSESNPSLAPSLVNLAIKSLRNPAGLNEYFAALSDYGPEDRVLKEGAPESEVAEKPKGKVHAGLPPSMVLSALKALVRDNTNTNNQQVRQDFKKKEITPKEKIERISRNKEDGKQQAKLLEDIYSAWVEKNMPEDAYLLDIDASRQKMQEGGDSDPSNEITLGKKEEPVRESDWSRDYDVWEDDVSALEQPEKGSQVNETPRGSTVSTAPLRETEVVRTPEYTLVLDEKALRPVSEIAGYIMAPVSQDPNSTTSPTTPAQEFINSRILKAADVRIGKSMQEMVNIGEAPPYSFDSPGDIGSMFKEMMEKDSPSGRMMRGFYTFMAGRARAAGIMNELEKMSGIKFSTDARIQEWSKVIRAWAVLNPDGHKDANKYLGLHDLTLTDAEIAAVQKETAKGMSYADASRPYMDAKIARASVGYKAFQEQFRAQHPEFSRVLDEMRTFLDSSTGQKGLIINTWAHRVKITSDGFLATVDPLHRSKFVSNPAQEEDTENIMADRGVWWSRGDIVKNENRISEIRNNKELRARVLKVLRGAYISNELNRRSFETQVGEIFDREAMRNMLDTSPNTDKVAEQQFEVMLGNAKVGGDIFARTSLLGIEESILPEAIADMLGSPQEGGIGIPIMASGAQAVAYSSKISLIKSLQELGKIEDRNVKNPPRKDSHQSYVSLASLGTEFESLYGAPELLAALKDVLTSPASNAGKRFLGNLIGYSHRAVTTFSTAGTIRQVFASPMFALTAGDWNITHFGDAASTVIRGIYGKDGEVGENSILRDFGITSTKQFQEFARTHNFLDQEIELAAAKAVQNQAKIKSLEQALKEAQAIGKITDPKVLASKWNAFVSTFDTTFQISDNVYKTYGFMNALSVEKAAHPEWFDADGKIKPDKQEQALRNASNYVKERYPTMSRMMGWAQGLQKAYMASFVSFLSEATRIGVMTPAYAYKDWKTGNPAYRARAYRSISGYGAALAMGSLGFSMISALLAGLDDDEIENYRNLLAPWEKDSRSLWFYKDKDGNLRHWNLEFTNYLGNLINPPMAAYEQFQRTSSVLGTPQAAGEAVVAFARGLVAPASQLQILPASALEAFINQKFEGGQVVNPELPWYQNLAGKLGHVGVTLVPASLRWLGKTPDMIRGENRKGEPVDWTEEVARGLVPTPRRAITFEKTAKAKFYELAERFRNAEQIFRVEARGLTNPDAIKTAEEYSNRAHKMASVDMIGVIRGLRGLPDADDKLIQSIAKQSQIKGNIVSDAMLGRVSNFKPSTRVLNESSKLNKVDIRDWMNLDEDETFEVP